MVQTAADDRLESAKDHLKGAISDLYAIEIEECYGHDEYSEEYKKSIGKSLQDLIVLKQTFLTTDMNKIGFSS